MSFFEAIQMKEAGGEAAPVSTLAPQSRVDSAAEPAGGPSAAPPASVSEPAPVGLIVADSAEQVETGRMRKSEFLGQLKTEVCASVNAAIAGTGRDTDGCPYITNWFDFYGRQGSGHLERAILKYAPEAAGATTARDYISAVSNRARQSAATWANTGEITGVPEDIPIGLPEMDLAGGLLSAVGGVAGMFFKARPGGANASVNPQAVQNQMGEGRSLDSPVRSRMESAFGGDFSHVRTHTDTTAAGLSTQFNARAFTVGNHIAFGAGEYQPGTLVGDALIAHELAHVIQQDGADTSVDPKEIHNNSYHSLEEDADRSALNALTSAWSGAKGMLKNTSHNIRPQLKTGLTLSRCKDDSPGKAAPTKATPTTTPTTKPAATGKTGTFTEKMTTFKTGVQGTIEFMPDPAKCPVCTKIRLVQVVRVFEKPGQDYTWTGAEKGREKVKTAEDTAKGIKPNFFVDHWAAKCSAGGKCSIYYRDHEANPSASQDGSNDGTTPEKASLADRAFGDADDIFEFETAARCDTSGKYLRSFFWGFTADSSGKVTKSSTSEQANPSATFLAAVAKFDKYYGNP
jgi:hypothetical protein